MAWRVLRRHPFYTAVSLFGISFTLAILMLMVAWFQNQFGAKAPLSKAASLVYLKQLQQKQIQQDTIWKVDSSLVNGGWLKDSTREIVNNASWTSQSGFGKDFLTRFFSPQKLTTAAQVTVMSQWSSYDVFSNNKKYNLRARHIDAAYFSIFNFALLKGRTFSPADIDQRALHTIITADLARRYFGNLDKAVGEQIVIDNNAFTVIGIVAEARTNNDFINADVFLPITYIDAAKDANGYFGSFAAVVECKQANTAATLSEIEKITASIPFLDPSQNNGANFNYMKVKAYDHLQLNALNFIYADDANESKRKLLLIVGTLLFIFCMVPVLNLVNLNVSRIMDRSAEIGVRKAFGASAAQIRLQVIFENVILTLIGGALGLLIALGLMALINRYQWLDALQLSFDATVYFTSLLITVIFGVLSGVLPAHRIAGFSIVNALKSK
ncbi:MAG: ABC transporter permease [Chitinophagaceae bacterium]|nr:ABC transporter permease [Chitinophagaceae bacterium]